MPRERTLSIVKPDAVGKNLIGEIYARFEKNGLRIAAGRTVRLDVLLQSGLRGETTGSGFEEPLLATEGAEISTAIPAEYAEALHDARLRLLQRLLQMERSLPRTRTY